MATAYFTKQGLQFLRDLRKHNDRDWFLKNKPRYEQDVRDPFLKLIADLAPGVKKIDASLVVDSRPTGGSMMRIYRDIRFSKDKSPYKTWIAAHFWHRRAKDGDAAPGFYLKLEPGASMIGGGVWHPGTEALRKIRERIVADSAGWTKATRGKKLGAEFVMGGEQLTRPPAGFDAKHPLIEDVKRKDFVMGVALTDEEVCDAALKSLVLKRFTAMGPMVGFLSGAMGLNAKAGS